MVLIITFMGGRYPHPPKKTTPGYEIYPFPHPFTFSFKQKSKVEARLSPSPHSTFVSEWTAASLLKNQNFITWSNLSSTSISYHCANQTCGHRI